jgi:hypothetical protein
MEELCFSILKSFMLMKESYIIKPNKSEKK